MRGSQRGVGVGEDVVDQPDLLSARGVDVLTGQRQFPQVPVGQNQRQPRQAADIGDDRQLDLADGKLRVGAGVAEVDGRDQVDATANAPAVDRCDRRRAAVGDRGDRLLHALHFGVEFAARPRHRAVGQHWGQRPAHRRQVEAVAEVAAGSGEDDGPHIAVGVEFGEYFRQFGPERRSHRVALAGADQRHLGDVVLVLDGD